jgi:hypothetical protein
MSLEIRLTAKSLSHIPDRPIHDDFEFILSNKSYSCPWYLAHILCPRLRTVVSTDPTITALDLATVDLESRFGDLIDLGIRGEFTFQATDRGFLVALAEEMGNYELYSSLLSGSAQSKSLSEIIARLSSQGDDFCAESSDIGFIASHFDEMNGDLFSKLSFDLAGVILSEANLRLKSEDVLYNLISSRIGADERFFSLFEFVHFEYLEIGTIERFSHDFFHHFEHFNFALWNRLCGRLCRQLQGHPNENCAMDMRWEDFPMPSDDEFRGIIAGLTSRYRGNVHDRGIVTVSASSMASGLLSNIVDFARLDGFSTQTDADPWVCYDFKDRLVKPTGVRVLFAEAIAALFPISLPSRLEQSMDGSTWTQLGQFTRFFNDRASRLDFSVVLREKAAECRFLRIRGNWPEARGIPLVVAAWEVFGSIRLNPEDPLARPGFHIIPPPPAPIDHDERPVWKGPRPRGWRGHGPRGHGGHLAHGGRWEHSVLREYGARPHPAFPGIVGHLSQQNEGDILISWSMRNGQSTGTVNVTRRNAIGVTLLTNTDYLQLRFPNHRIWITNYAIQAKGSVDTATAPEWELSLSLDGENWNQADQRRGVEFPTSLTTFPLAAPRECSWVRYRLTSARAVFVEVQVLEVFGSILN